MGILGVVIAMTMPMMMTKYQKQTTAAKLKKYYSELYNAFALSIAENGDSKNWQYPQNSNITPEEFMNEYFLKYLKLKKYNKYVGYDVKNFKGTSSHLGNTSVTYDWNGACLFVRSNNQFLFMTIDLNCAKPPNIVGRDIFDLSELYWAGPKKPVVPELKYDRELLIDLCKLFSFARGDAIRCLAIIAKDGWEIKKDYPW